MKEENTTQLATSATSRFSLLKLLGRDGKCVAKCPEDEINALKRQCFANLYSATFVTAGCASGLIVGGVELPIALSAGIAFGTGILLYDTAYAEKASNNAVYVLVNGKKTDIRSHALARLSTIPRLSVAAASALFVSTLALQIFFGADAEAHRALSEEQNNRSLVDEYQLIVDNEEKVRIVAAELESEAELAQNEARNLLIQSLFSAREDVVYWDLVADCEKFGASPGRGCPEDVSGVPGTQQKYNYAIERRDSQRTLAIKYQSELENYPNSETTTARRELETWREIKSDRALKMAKADPDYIEYPDTLLYQIQSLYQLAHENTLLFLFILSLDILLIAFDTMGLQIASWKSNSPGRYEYLKANELLERDSSLRRNRAVERLKGSRLLEKIEKIEHDITLRRFAREQWHKGWQDSIGGADEPPTNPIH